MEQPMYASMPLTLHFRCDGLPMPSPIQTASLPNQFAAGTYGSNPLCAPKTTFSPSFPMNDLVPSQSQQTLGVGQLPLSRSLARLKRIRGIVALLHNLRLHSTSEVDFIGLERARFTNSPSHKDASSFLTKQSPPLNHLIFDCKNLVWTTVSKNQGPPPLSVYGHSHDMSYRIPSHNHPVGLSRMTGVSATVLRNNRDVVHTTNDLSVSWNPPSIDMVNPSLSLLRSYSSGNPPPHSQVAQNWNDAHQGPSQYGAIRNGRNRHRNYGPYMCPNCQCEFTVSQRAGHTEARYGREDQTNRMICSAPNSLSNDGLGNEETVLSQGSRESHAEVSVKNSIPGIMKDIKKESV